MSQRPQAGQRSWEAEMFRLLVENVQDYAIFLVDPEGRVQTWSAGAERLLGYQEEIIGHPAALFFTPEDVANGVPQQEMLKALQTGRGEDDRWHVRKDGSRFWSHGVMTPLKDESGILRSFAKIMRDQTEIKRVEEALRESEERFRGLMEQAPFSVQLFAPDGRTLRVNRTWEELWGARLDQMEPYNILHDPQLEKKGIAPYIRRAFAGEAVHIPPIEYDPNQTLPGLTRYPDPRRWVAAVVYPLKDEAGHVREVVLIHDDITDRRRAEVALRDSEQRFVRFMQHLPGLAWIKDLQGHYVYANDAAVKAFRMPRAELYGKKDGEIFPPQTAAQFKENDRRALGSETGVQVIETLEHEDGTLHHSLVSKFPIFGSEEEAGLVGGMAIDITDRLRAEESLKEADRLKDEFLAMLAHELRNPLAPIRNALHILKMPGANGAVFQQMRDMAERQVQHMARLLDDLLDVSRISRGKIELRKEALDLTAVVNRSVEAVRSLFEQRQHELTVSLPPSSLRVEGDATRLEQVLTNLLNNAAKYTDPGGKSWLTAHPVGNEIVLRVRDTGIGIVPEMLPRIFDLFVQVERRLDRSQGGVGIGLTLVKKLVELHGGSITAHSPGLGQGSEFLVRLPALPAERPDEKARIAEQGSITNLPRRRILVVDDNSDAADSLALLLQLAGQDVRAVYDGPSALAQAEAFRPELVFLDIGMPGMDGYEVARRLRRQSGLETVLLVALTGWGQEEDRRRSQEAGFDRHLVKPVEPKALATSLADLKMPKPSEEG